MNLALCTCQAALVVLITSSMATGKDAKVKPIVVMVGGRKIVVPPPPGGFVRCDGINKGWDKVIASVLPPDNRMLATFASPADEALIRAGTPGNMSRNYNLQVLRSLESKEIGEATFNDEKSSMKKEISDMEKSIAAKFAEVAEQGNQKLNREFGVDLALSFTNTAMLGIFEDTSTGLGFTMAMKVAVEADQARNEDKSVVAGMIAPVNGRLLLLYSTAAYSSEADRMEVEKTVKEWRDAFLAANPRVAGPRSGVDWVQVAESGLKGAGIGLAVGIAIWLQKKFKRPHPFRGNLPPTDNQSPPAL